MCQDVDCKDFPEIEPYRVCEDCNCYFKNDTCFNSHKKKSIGNLSRCDKFYRSKDCCKILNEKKHPKDDHNCGDYSCYVCKQIVQPGHLCYIQKADKERDDEQTGTGTGKGKGKKKKEPEFKFLFFDFESMIVDKTIVDAYDHEYFYEKKHEINCAIAQKSCSFCQHKDLSEYCEFCKEKEVVFLGENVQEQFCKWLFGRENNGYTCFAHNFRSYDGHFVMQYGEENGFKINHVKNGGKVMMLECIEHRMRFLDSLNFIPMPLKNLPKSFDLHEFKKGYFPHLFNTKDNQNCIGKFPDKKYFDPDGMLNSDRENVFKWYESNSNHSNYNFQKEMESYCRSDVDILHRCIINFRALF